MNQNNTKNQSLMLRRWRNIGLAGCIAIFGAAGCREKEASPVFVPVKVKTLQSEDVVISSRFSGSVEPLQSTALAFKLAGTVERLHRVFDRNVQVGDVLAKGTVIAELEEGDLRRAKASAEAKVAQLEARVATAKDTLEIATRIYQRFVNSSGSVSKSARDDADSKRVSAAGELAAAEHALADARVQLDQANDNYVNRQLIVPFDNATVAEKRIEPGERKQAHEIAFRLIDIATVHIIFGVPDTMVGDPVIGKSATDRIYLGRKLQITADAFEGRALQATVTKIAPEADPKTRTFRTELTLANPSLPDGQPLLRPGMIVTVRVGSENDRHVTLLPLASIHRGSSDSDLMVYEAVMENDRAVARARKVSLGDVYNSQVEILPESSEVHSGSQVIVSTAERLADGVIVRVAQDSNGSAAVLPEAK